MPYDLEKRTLEFSKRLLNIVREMPKNVVNDNMVNQCIRSGSSVGANYREANDALGKKDFVHRMKIARKEAKETMYWLELLIEFNPTREKNLKVLFQEATELKNILSAIILKSQAKDKSTSGN